MKKLLAFSGTILVLFLIACGTPPAPQGPRYSENRVASETNACRFAVHPLYNPAQLSGTYQPLLDYLRKRIPSRDFVLEASKDYPSYEDKIRAGNLEILVPNPLQALLALNHGYEMIAEAGDPEDFKGIFLVRKDGPIKEIADIQGKKFSYPAPTALAACLMPQYFLHEHGIDVGRDIENRFVGSQKASILNVLLKEVDVGVTWPPPWRLFQKERPDEAGQLKVIWETPPLINLPVMVRRDLPESLKKDFLKALLDLPQDPDGKSILEPMEIQSFFAHDDRRLSVVRDFVDRFEKEVHPIGLEGIGMPGPASSPVR